MSFWKWSKTSATNATADPSINWAEGMPPSAVNDSGRAMMAAAAKFRDDISGAIVTSGTNTAYTVSTNQVFDTLDHLDGAMIAFTPHQTNTGPVTLNVDSIGAKPIRSAPGVEIPSNSLIAGTPYVVTYNNADSAWYLQGGLSNAYSIPLGGGIDYWGSTAPNSAFAFPTGQAISRATYSSLFALIGTTYGVGDGATTFNLPNKVERVSVMKSTTPSLLTSTYFGGNSSVLGATGGAESQTLTVSQIPSHRHDNYLTDPGHAHTYLGPVYAATSFESSSGVQSASNQWTSTATTGVTITNAYAGGGSAHPIVQPSIVCNYIMRVI